MYYKNYSKASEFLWGSLNALAYAIGLLHGEKLSDYGKVVNFITVLANININCFNPQNPDKIHFRF